MIIFALFIALVAAPATHASWNTSNKDASVTVFAATSANSNGSGYGIALDRYDTQLTDLSYVSLGSVRIIQSAKLTPKVFSGYPVYIGLVAGYADPATPDATVSRGFVSGLQVILAKSKSKSGLSFDLRASSLSSSLNPIKWVSDPDVLWGGVGASYSF